MKASKKNEICEDGENGEKWMGCMTCEHSFHVRCLLSFATQTQMEEGIQKAKKEANRCLCAISIDSEGKRRVENLEKVIQPAPYQCKKW